MAFIRKTGKTKFMWLPVTTSTAFTKGQLVIFTSGLIASAGATTNRYAIVGVIAKTIASTDSDYATARSVPVEVPIELYTEWEADYDGTHTFATTDVGSAFDIDSTALLLNQSGTTYKVGWVTQFINSKKVRCVLIISPLATGTI